MRCFAADIFHMIMPYMFVVDHEPKEFAQFHTFNFTFTNFKMGHLRFFCPKVS